MEIGQVVKVKSFAVNNQLGGTSMINNVEVLAKITDGWYDYEIGTRFIGELFREQDIEISKELGKCSYTPEDYKEYGEKMYQETLKAYNEYNPKIIYFGEFDLK